MTQRIITAGVLLALLIPVIILGGALFEIVLLTFAIIGYIEIMQMAKIRLKSPETLIGIVAMLGLAIPENYFAYFRLTPLLLLSLCAFLLLIIMVFSENRFSYERVGVMSLSALYVGLGAHYIISIRHMGLSAMLFLIFVIYMTDTFAYFVGRSLGKRKLAPHISPNKTLEGSLGGSLVACVLSLAYIGLFQKPFDLNGFGLIVMAIGISIAGQMGDLIESALKRFYHTKDSGNIFPGHGGVLDRFDSILFGAVACNLLLIILQ